MVRVDAMTISQTEKFEIEQIVRHIGGKNKAIELVRLAAKPSLTGNSQEALDALRALVSGSRRPAGVFPILELAVAGVQPGQRELDLQRTLDLLKRYCNLA